MLTELHFILVYETSEQIKVLCVLHLEHHTKHSMEKYREKSTKYTKQTCQSRAKIVTNINDYLRNKHDFHLYDTCLTQNIYKTKYIPKFKY